MKSNKLILILILGFLYKVEGFSYDNTNWAIEYPTCGGSRQTPIDIRRISKISFGMYSTYLKVQNINKVPLSVEVKNGGNGANFVFTWDGPTPTISDGPLKSVYTLHSLHFHWGPKNNVGSEHLVDGRSTPIEGHLIFQNNNYGSFNEALKNGDGLTVLGVRYICRRTAKPFALLEFVKNIPNYNDKITVSSNVPRLTEILDGAFFRFVYYEGSLTTPPCSEAVQWIFNYDSVSFNCNQLEYFRAMKNEAGNKVLRNYRPVQPLNNRRLLRSFGVIN